MTIVNQSFRNAMKKAGLEKIQLEKNGNYFYIWSDDKEVSEYLASQYYTSILVHAFKDLTIQQWIEEISLLLE